MFIAAGTIILWTGFYGFNGGSVDFHANENPIDWIMEVARVCVNTTVSAAMAGEDRSGDGLHPMVCVYWLTAW